MRLAFVVSFFLAALLAAGTASCGPTQCGSQNCATGCCNTNGICVAGGENAVCGGAGNACINCVSSGQICGAGTCVTLDAGVADAGAFSCPRSPVQCSDQAIQQLDLKMSVATGLITSVAEPDAGFKSTINATGGGFPPTDSYVYARFTTRGLEKLPISDLTALDSMDWDIAFRRYVIRINSGDSGPACVAAQVLPVGTAYEGVASVPGDFLPEEDDFLTRPPACAFVDDGSGLGSSPRTYLATFYQYTGCVRMTGRVYIVRTQLGRHVKFTTTSYYATEAAQQTCQDTASSGGALGGTIRARWQYLD